MYELIIIGAGPAGITAGVYAARQRIKTMVITRDIGGQTAISGAIENYTGYQFISGQELAKKFQEHLTQFEIGLKSPEEVISVSKNNEIISVKTDRQVYESKALIIASGKMPRLLNVPGEKEFRNKGVSYCAVCDGPIFSGKVVAVIGGGNSALDAANQMRKLVCKVYIININPHLGGETTLREKVESDNKVEVLNNAVTKEISGDSFVKGIKVEMAGKIREIAVEGVFIEVGLIPASGFIDIVEKNQWGEIKVNNHCATNVSGIFAAGDVTDVPEKQIIIAAGEGSKAALSVTRFLAKIKE
jgi:alkyl hydroperoxide reductase subunit F